MSLVEDMDPICGLPLPALPLYINRILRSNNASAELMYDAEIIYETLLTDYKLDFIRVLIVFDAFVEINSSIRKMFEVNHEDTIQYDVLFMLVWSRLLNKCKPLVTQNETCTMNVVITCLYLTYSIQGIEIMYPLKPFLPYIETQENAIDDNNNNNNNNNNNKNKNVEEIAREKRYIIYSLSTKISIGHFSMSILAAPPEDHYI